MLFKWRNSRVAKPSNPKLAPAFSLVIRNPPILTSCAPLFFPPCSDLAIPTRWMA